MLAMDICLCDNNKELSYIYVPIKRSGLLFLLLLHLCCLLTGSCIISLGQLFYTALMAQALFIT